MPWRSAITGEYVDHAYAEANPDTVVFEEPEHDPKPSDQTGMTDDLGPVPEAPTDQEQGVTDGSDVRSEAEVSLEDLRSAHRLLVKAHDHERAEAERLRDEARRQARIANGAMIDAERLREALEQIRDGIFSGNQAATWARKALERNAASDITALPSAEP